MAARARCKTVVGLNALDDSVATFLFNRLRNEITWVEGVRSRKRGQTFTRMARSLPNGSRWFIELMPYISYILESITDQTYTIDSIYLNYYQDGNMWTPNHSHKGTHQLVISLGADRTLVVNKKNIVMKNGDVIIFGSAVHGVPKEPEVTEGRISIATFMTPF